MFTANVCDLTTNRKKEPLGLKRSPGSREEEKKIDTHSQVAAFPSKKMTEISGC